MIVDDHETNRRILALQAEKWKMVPVQFSSPFAALEAIKSGGRFDIGVLDMHMPGMDGMQLLDAITKAPVLNETRFVALTEHDEEISAARRSGAHIALPKTRSEELQTMLIKNISEAQRRPLPGKARADESEASAD